MSQTPAKNASPIKKEGSASGNSQANAESNEQSNQGWQEIPLKYCSKSELDNIRYHILKFHSKQDVDIVRNFTKPVRLHRKDPRNIQFQLTREEIDKRKREQAQEVKKEQDDVTPTEGSNGEDVQTSGSSVDINQVAPDGGARKHKKNLFKRKTRQINLMNEEKRKLRYEEYYPWVIEDYDGKKVFVGSYEAGSSDTQHVLFVFDKDGFKLVPAEKVYKFTPRNKYATLTLEEAEAKMEKKSSVPRWLMKHMEENATTDGTQDQRYRNNSPTNGLSVPNSNSSRRLKTVTGATIPNDRDSDHDDLDFEEEFADDEEAPIMDGDEEENKLSEQKIKKEQLKAAHFDGQSDADADDDNIDDLFESEKSRKVDKEGEKLRKVLNKTEGGVYDSDNDDKINPYLSKSDLESEDDSDNEIKVKSEAIDDESALADVNKATRVFNAINVGNGFVKIKAPRQFLENFPDGDWNPQSHKRQVPPIYDESPRKKAKTEESFSKSTTPVKNDSATRSSSPVDSDLNSSGPDGLLVTINEVIGIVKDNPLTTKELLMRLKSRVNSYKDNKQRIISIVKQNLRLVDGKLVLKDSI